jgi:DNA polymerase alpha subunit A
MAASRAVRLAELAELTAIKKGHGSALDALNFDDDVDVYDNVDDDEYKTLVRKRLDRDDFVVDDNGEGYVDDGREDWDEEKPYDDSESDGDKRRKGKTGTSQTSSKPSLIP